MWGRALSVLAAAAVLAVAVAAALDSIRGEETAAIAPAASRTPQDCLDRAACRRRVRELVAFFRGCARSWNEPANRASRAAVVAGGFDAATLFRSSGGRCSLYLVASGRERILVARQVEAGWLAVGGARRPPAADDFRDAWPVAIRPDGTVSLRGG